ncbi:hypothetical protein [Leptothermofonsia sp. ETS-13]|uniref:hypothetical protein n=1 Tax=Leptothermofonsia sp. ETS-13 TaxID=3035696 RepID=UPI003BA096DD
MNLCLTLKLMTIPTLIGSLLTLSILVERASAINANQAAALTLNQASCDLPPEGGLKPFSMRHQNQSITMASADSIAGEPAILNFSEAESDAAAILFGCDCPACINTLRELRSQSLFNRGNGSGHCWTSLQRRVSPQTMQEVLQDLEMREAGQSY